MSCCDWVDFEEGVNMAFKRKAASLVLIDWKRARRDWKRHHCTGAEAAAMQLLDLAREGEYNHLLPRQSGGGGGMAITA